MVWVAQAGGGTRSAPVDTPTVTPTSIVPTTPTTPVEPPPAGDRTVEFIALIGPENYVQPTEMEEFGAPGTNSRGTYPCRAGDGKVVWTYPLGGTYTSFHAVAVPTGKPNPSTLPTVTFTVVADGQPVANVALDALDKSAPIDVSLEQVQSLRLEVTVDSTKQCTTLVANWADMKVT